MLTKEAIVKLLETDDRAIARALVVLTARQTNDEQASENTRYLNGRGYRPCHARMGTSMSKFFQQRGYLSPKQIGYWRVKDKTGSMRIGIYAGQLLEEAQNKAAKKAAQPTVVAVQMVDPLGSRDARVREEQRLRMELGMVMDSDDDKIINAASKELDDFMARVKIGN